MVEGRIKWFNGSKGYGFIEREGEDDLFIHISQWCGPLGSEPREGDRVAFEVGPGKKGKLEAKDARPAGMEPVRPVEEPRRKIAPARWGGYRFLNPYNFVRPLDKPRPEDNVLGNCPPPPHDRYVEGLLTGCITCSVTAVTPLFISDSHAVEGMVGEHRSFRFFEYDGKPAIPASSLRGMIRSVFEAVTNSCFAVFDGERRLEFRERPEYGNEVKDNAGIVRRLAQPATDKHPAIDGEIELCQVGKVGAYYEANEAWKNVLGRKPNGQMWQCGERVVARARRRRRDWLVREIAETRQELGPLQDGDDYVEGWLKITGRGEDTNKRSETLFLDPSMRPGTGSVAFSYDVQQDYNFVLTNQINQGDLPIEPQSTALSIVDLVWVELPKRRGRSRARRIVRVQVPRIPYRKTVGELLSKGHLHRCAEYETLCPACRVFGWVYQAKPDAEPDNRKRPEDRIAYAGRVRLTHAHPCYDDSGKLLYSQMRDANGKLKEIPLAILSTPKPTTTQFYLLKDRQPDGDVTYDDAGAQLRGRKFYRHHGEKPSHYTDGRGKKRYEYERVGDIQDGQNRTVRGVVEPGSVFELELEFENLHPLELGALVWALELEKGMHHRLGYGKPLGLGSVAIKVNSLKVLKPEDRYSSLLSDGWGGPPKGKDDLVKDFVNEMKHKDRYGEAFEQVLKELRSLLGAPPIPAIHYPREGEEPTEKGENFKWFVGNKCKDGPHIPLGLASKDGGLPLIDERGRIRR